MKKGLQFTTYIALALILMSGFAHAQTSTVTTGDTAIPGEVAGVSTTADAPMTLTARKAAAETSLRTLQTQFALFATRTQLTIDRLTTKGVDTTTAQAALTTAGTSLTTAKTELDLFAQIVITDETTDTTALKASLTKIQTSLAEARTHLIESLTLLKTSVSLTIDAQQ